MGELMGSGTRLNLLSLEALAAAQHLSADQCIAEADNNPELRTAASSLGVVVRVIGNSPEPTLR